MISRQIRNQVTMTYSNIAPIRSHIESGRLKVLAYLGEERAVSHPAAPPTSSGGVSNVLPGAGQSLPETSSRASGGARRPGISARNLHRSQKNGMQRDPGSPVSLRPTGVRDDVVGKVFD